MPKVEIAKLTSNKHQPQRDGITSLADSMMAIGQVTPIVISPEEDGFSIIAGHRRVEAAKLLDWKEIEAVVLEGDELKQVAALAADNLQREDFSEMQAVELAQTMLDLGADIAMVADVTGFSQKSIKSATKAAAKIEKTTELMSMSLDEALVYNAAAGDEEIKQMLDESRGTDQWEHTKTRAMRELTAKQNIAKLTAELTEKSTTIIEQPSWDDKTIISLASMCPSGVTLAEYENAHKAECAGHAVYITTGYDGEAHAHSVCTDARSYHDWKGKERSSHEEEELAKARAGRQFKKDMAAPTEVRRQWIKDDLLKKKTIKGEEQFLAWGISKRQIDTSDLAFELASIKRQRDGDHQFDVTIPKVEARAHTLSLAMVIAKLDEETRLCQGIDHFRATYVPDYLRFLMKNGYVLSPHEELFVKED